MAAVFRSLRFALLKQCLPAVETMKLAAFRCHVPIHFPDSNIDLKCRFRLKFEELFYISSTSCNIRQQGQKHPRIHLFRRW